MNIENIIWSGLALLLVIIPITNFTKKLLKKITGCLKDHKRQNSIGELLHKVTHTIYQRYLISRVGVAKENAPLAPNVKNAWKFTGDRFSFIFTDDNFLFINLDGKEFSVWEKGGNGYFCCLEGGTVRMSFENSRKLCSILELVEKFRGYAIKRSRRAKQNVEPELA